MEFKTSETLAPKEEESKSEKESSVMPSFDRRAGGRFRDCSVLTCSIFFLFDTFAILTCGIDSRIDQWLSRTSERPIPFSTM